jgi:ABC-type transporter Mla MlaB component
MLKITRAVLSKKETTLRLDGRITGQWVGLLQESAQSVLDEEVTLSVDLKNIYFIDCEGIALLRSLLDQGAYVVNASLFVVEQIRKCKDAQSL